jgi:para-nitrobenzyl esterase
MSLDEDLRPQTLDRTGPIATTAGPIRGYRDGGLEIFKGVRYGAAPVGALRFKPPTSPAPWREPVDTLSLGAPAIQVVGKPGELTGGRSAGDPAAPGQPGSSEDCLFLNIWTPACDTAKRPVMVWLHGGGFGAGSGGAAMYDGEALALRGDTVIVTINHRLNVFGYLHLGQLGGHPSSGMAGMLDIVQALEWVRDNIAGFGGDPANVTIFGESGGGFKVSILLAMDGARGLFHKAVIQSGPGLRVTPTQQATAIARALLDALGIKPGDLAVLESLPAETIQDAANILPAELRRGGMGMAPCIDGITLTRDPFAPDAPLSAHDVPVLIGTNKDESTLFLRGTPGWLTLTEEELAERARAAAKDKAPALLAELRRVFPAYEPPFLLSALQTAMGMWFGSVQIAERKAAQGGAPAYMYQLTWETPVARGQLKSPHALEIPLVFDNVEKARSFVGRGEEPQAVAEQMSAAWLAFARTGDPNAPGLPHWPAYDARGRATMMFDVESRVENDPYAGVRAILEA